MLRIGTIVLGVQDVRRAVDFRTAALGYVTRDQVDEDRAVLIPAGDAPGPGLSPGRSETPVQDRPRVHLDPYAGGADDRAAEVERLMVLGDERVDRDGWTPDADFVVLADTEGNRFCVIDTGPACLRPEPTQPQKISQQPECRPPEGSEWWPRGGAGAALDGVGCGAGGRVGAGAAEVGAVDDSSRGVPESAGELVAVGVPEASSE